MHLTDWLEDVNKLTTDDPIKLVIANKNDLDEEKITEDDLRVIINLIMLEFHK